MTHNGRVSPFGNPRINGRSPLPAAYRSVLRPSSPLSAKASTKCPSTLDPTTNQHAGTSLPDQGSKNLHPDAPGRHRPLSTSSHTAAGLFATRPNADPKIDREPRRRKDRDRKSTRLNSSH